MFVDIDYPELLTKKLKVVSETPQLAYLVGPAQKTGSLGSVLYRTPHYIAIGYDLANLEALDDVLAKELNAKSSMILCTAEVSVTYMHTEAADSLIGWAAQYQDSMSETIFALCIARYVLIIISAFLLARTMFARRRVTSVRPEDDSAFRQLTHSFEIGTSVSSAVRPGKPLFTSWMAFCACHKPLGGMERSLFPHRRTTSGLERH